MLSRRDVVRCANCLTHLEVVAYFPLSSLPKEARDRAEFGIVIDHRGEESLPEAEPRLLAPDDRRALPAGLSIALAVID